jgi:hypothetical protein
VTRPDATSENPTGPAREARPKWTDDLSGEPRRALTDGPSEYRPAPLETALKAARDAFEAARVIARAARWPTTPAAPELPAWRALRQLVGPETRETPATPAVADATLAQLAFKARVTTLAATRRPPLAPLLARQLAMVERHAGLLELVAAEVGEALGAVGAEATCLLKGSAAIAHVYARPAERERRDLDLLVDPAAFRDVRARLWNTGWRDDPTRDAPGPPFSGRTIAMLRRFGPATVSLDLHRDLVDRGWCGLRGPAFRRAFLGGAARGLAPLPVSSTVDTALHTLAHLAAGGFRPTLGAWIDLTRLMPPLEPDRLAEAATRYRLRAVAWLGVRTLARWFGLALPAHEEALTLPRAHAALLGRVFRGEGAELMAGAPTELRAVRAARALLRDLG